MTEQQTTEDVNLNNNTFALHNVYVKDLSFESPNTPHIFSSKWDPKVEFDLEIGSSQLEDNAWESTLKVTVKVSVAVDDKATDPKVAFLAETILAGIFSVGEAYKGKMEDFLAITAPTILLPYMREIMSNLIIKGGFPNFIIPHIDFEDMHKQRLAKV